MSRERGQRKKDRYLDDSPRRSASAQLLVRESALAGGGATDSWSRPNGTATVSETSSEKQSLIIPKHESWFNLQEFIYLTMGIPPGIRS